MNKHHNKTKGENKKGDEHKRKGDKKFVPVSINLGLQNNLLLNKTNSYIITFSAGIVEGNGIKMNEKGNEIKVRYEGSYMFEITGDATVFSDVNVTLLYESKDFSKDVLPFTKTNISKTESKLQLKCIPTILPLKHNQKIIVKLIAEPDENIMLMDGLRLLIHRVS
jgi:hypothetical protein